MYLRLCLFLIVVFICVVRLLFVLFYVLFVCKCVLPPDDNPIAANKYIIYHIIWNVSGSECTVYRILARDVGYGAGLSGSNISAEARMQILRVHAR
jgi:hypothetical protein